MPSFESFNLPLLHLDLVLQPAPAAFGSSFDVHVFVCFVARGQVPFQECHSPFQVDQMYKDFYPHLANSSVRQTLAGAENTSVRPPASSRDNSSFAKTGSGHKSGRKRHSMIRRDGHAHGRDDRRYNRNAQRHCAVPAPGNKTLMLMTQ